MKARISFALGITKLEEKDIPICSKMSSEILKLFWKGEIPTTFYFEIMTSISFPIYQIKLLPTTEETTAPRCHLDALSKSENLYSGDL